MILERYYEIRLQNTAPESALNTNRNSMECDLARNIQCDGKFS